MDQSSSGGTQVVIKLDQRVFYGLIAIIGVVGIFGLGIFLGRSLSRPAAVPVAQQQLPSQPSGFQAQSGQQFQLNPAQPAQSDQQVPLQQPAQSQASSPAGDDVPIGDNPRLALPELKDKNYTWDFGDVKPDQKVEKTLVLKNTGTKELKIEDVSSSCGCTAALVTSDTIASGGETQLLVTYDPRVNKDKGTFIDRKVRIRSNDPAAPVAEFSITANVTN
jgi:hypothetical protein